MALRSINLWFGGTTIQKTKALKLVIAHECQRFYFPCFPRFATRRPQLYAGSRRLADISCTRDVCRSFLFRRRSAGSCKIAGQHEKHKQAHLSSPIRDPEGPRWGAVRFLFGGFSSTAGYAFRQTRLTLQIPRDSQASGVSCTHYRLITSCTVSQVFILATEDQKSANKPSIEIQLRTCGTSLSASVPGVSDGGFRSCRLTKKSVTAILPPPGAGQNARKQP